MASKPKKTLRGKTVFLTGNSKSIGKAIALSIAKDGSNIVFASEIDMSDVVKEVNATGARAMCVKMDPRKDDDVKSAVDKAVKRFDGIDILINNTNMVTSTDTQETVMKDFDEVFSVNIRATYIIIKECLPHLKLGRDPHILIISPPLNLHRRWLAGRAAYTMAKYNMSMCVLAMAQEFKGYGIMVNSLWPRHIIQNEIEAKANTPDVYRKPDIMGDAAYSILVKEPKPTGLHYLDDQALKEDGIDNYEKYCVNSKFVRQLLLNTFVDDSGVEYKKTDMTKRTMKVEKHEIGTRFNEVVEKIHSLLDEALTKKVNALYHITVNGVQSKEATLDLRASAGSGSFKVGPPSEKVDLHLIMDDACFYEIFIQGIKPMFHYTNSRFKAEGDPNKIILLNNLVTACRSKV